MKRKGSALLVVLGMMAFMVVSAVAFSAYMRTSRLPSSYLRRSNASRQLAKAAVAEAIDAVDRAIANNPHPGVGTETVETDGRSRNLWRGRVLLATNRVDEVGKTVPVLTMEALAYIPPPLVNDVRYYSRLTPNAAWHSFGFDAGRYAFCAVDVSDYLDVNRLAADRPRSSAPVRRISLSYLFENGREHTSSGSGASQWDTFMEQFRTLDDATLAFKYDSKLPLVSIADLNLALGEGGKGGLTSPFCSYVNTSGGDGFYNASSDDQLDKFRRMTFVTDSWFGGSSRASNDEESGYDEIYDLTDPQYQPFPASLLGGPAGSSVATLGAIMGCTTQSKARLLDSIPVLSLVSLFDYLDSDKVPVSLACPTFERTPMICGLKPNMNGGKFALRLEPGFDTIYSDANCQNPAPDDAGQGPRTVYAKYIYKIDPNEFGTALTKLTLSTLTVYPFPHDDGVDDTTFTVDGRAVFFLSQDDKPVALRTGSSADRLHAATRNMTDGKGLSSANGTLTVPFKQRSRDFTPGGMEEQDAVFEDTLNSVISPSDVSSEVFATIVYEWQQNWDSSKEAWEPASLPAIGASNCRAVGGNNMSQCFMPPLNEKGEPDPAFVGDAFANTLNNGGKNVTLCMALMARIADKNDKTVDLVPAHILDDKTFNNINNSVAFPPNQVAGDTYPVMLFPTEVHFAFSQAGLSEAVSPKPADFTVKAVMIDDPRYNYAPESWYDANGDISKQTWLNNNGSRDRDGDIFLATSDQGYMQSIYELAFLPRLSNMENGGGIVGPEYKNPDDGRKEFLAQERAMNSHIMWSSYRPFATKLGAADDFEGMGFTSSGSGFKVNPYSDSTNVLMAAFANTPVDWRLASTNNREVASIRTMKSSEFNKNYAWNEYATETTFKWKDLEAVAGRFMDAICPQSQRNSPSASYTEWQTAWRNLGWMYDPDSPESFCGGNISDGTADLWGVDRKFLYGYWRDCFAAKQQLFLVFVRAEPFMMGGQGVSQSPPQLGARAVALVWRDPAKSSYTDPSTGKTGYPHRTRVLFYRQFE